MTEAITGKFQGAAATRTPQELVAGVRRVIAMDPMPNISVPEATEILRELFTNSKSGNNFVKKVIPEDVAREVNQFGLKSIPQKQFNALMESGHISPKKLLEAIIASSEELNDSKIPKDYITKAQKLVKEMEDAGFIDKGESAKPSSEIVRGIAKFTALHDGVPRTDEFGSPIVVNGMRQRFAVHQSGIIEFIHDIPYFQKATGVFTSKSNDSAAKPEEDEIARPSDVVKTEEARPAKAPTQAVAP